MSAIATGRGATELEVLLNGTNGVSTRTLELWLREAACFHPRGDGRPEVPRGSSSRNAALRAICAGRVSSDDLLLRVEDA